MAMAELLAPAGSMMLSVIFVTVRSRFAGRKDFTPESRVSKLAPTPVSFREEVRRLEMEEKPRKRSVVGAVVGVGAEVIIVMRVVARTLGRVGQWELFFGWSGGELTV